MTAVAEREPKTDPAVARLVADYEALAASSSSRSPSWLRELRERAIRRFAETGFPSTKDEWWRFTSVEPIARGRFAPGAERALADVSEVVRGVAVGDAGSLVAAFVNGRFSPHASSLKGLPKGVTIGGLAAGIESQAEVVRAHLGQVADIEANPFTALNTAFFQDGAFVHVARNVVVEQPIQLIFVSSANGEPTVAHPRGLLVFEDGAQASLVEQYVGAGGTSWTNAVSEFVLGENAVVDAYRVQREREDAFHTATTQSRQGRSSVYSSVVFAFGSRLARHDITATLDGEGAECTLNGLSVLRGEQHVDHHTTLVHAKPHCPSWEVFNGVFDDRSRGVFTGRIIVQPGAQRTDSKQTNNNLLLSAEARADSQPQLEIYADDVKCTHGATLGPIDSKALFYLRSRGLDFEAARNLLTYGFGAEVLNSVSVEPLREQLDALLRVRLEEGARKRSTAG
jgi:Fe-S cluster assembly protein SufD